MARAANGARLAESLRTARPPARTCHRAASRWSSAASKCVAISAREFVVALRPEVDQASRQRACNRRAGRTEQRAVGDLLGERVPEPVLALGRRSLHQLRRAQPPQRRAIDSPILTAYGRTARAR